MGRSYLLVQHSLWYAAYPGSVVRGSLRSFSYTNSEQNAYAADYDDSRYRQPYDFLPERFLKDTESGTPHYAYGAGSRMCAGSHLANRELYTAYIRLITAFEILPPKDPSDKPILDAIECSANPTSLTTDPKPFKVGLKIRPEARLDEWIAASDERTRDL